MKNVKRLRGTRRPPVQASTARSPASWFSESFGTRDSSAGVWVSESTAMGLSAYYCGVNMISGTIASLPLNVYRTDGRKREIATSHPVHRLLHAEPNSEMTAMSLRQTWLSHAITHGNAYGEIQWDWKGDAYAINPLMPSTRPVRDDTNALWYKVLVPTGETRYLKPEDVLHVPGLGYDGVMGYGLLQLARESIGLNAAQDSYAARFFRNGGNISGSIETDKVLDDKQFSRLKSEVANKLQGLENAHRIAILEGGMKFKPMNPTHEEAQLIEARRFTVEEWARWLNMPPHKLREMTHATFSNIEHQNIEWVVDTIRPWLVRFEQEFDRKLFRKRSVFYTKHVVEGLLRGDLKSRYDAYAIARNWGWMSANDILELEDRNPLPGDLGDMYLVPLNMVSAEFAGDPPAAAAAPSIEPSPEPSGPPDPADDQMRRMARSAAERLVTLEASSIDSKGAPRTRERVISAISESLAVPLGAAEKYWNISRRLDHLADEYDGAESLRKARVEALMNIVFGRDGHA
jgi:HK97 family phage portal protein